MKKKEGKKYFTFFNKYTHFSKVKLYCFVLHIVIKKRFSFTFRIVYKDFMRHFVLNLKSQEGNSLIRPKLQPSRMPVSSLPLR